MKNIKYRIFELSESEIILGTVVFVKKWSTNPTVPFRTKNIIKILVLTK